MIQISIYTVKKTTQNKSISYGFEKCFHELKGLMLVIYARHEISQHRDSEEWIHNLAEDSMLSATR